MLDIKLLRDLQRLWAQALAIALVIAGGVAAFLLAVGSSRALDETRAAYYDRYLFADVFASLRRAPKSLVNELVRIPGVAAVDVRIAKLALIDIPNFREPATGQLVSLPEDGRQPMLNRLYLRLGRLPEPGRAQEVIVNEAFAQEHGFRPGSRFSATLNGRKQELMVVGIALSPEFVYARGPGDIMPDNRRFGIIWISEKVLASAYDLEGAFSSVSLRLLKGASERDVIRRVDSLLEPYGGQAAYARKDQTSHAFLDHELDMLANMSRTLPPIFLLVAAFLVNITMSRFIALEREQIGLLKALGFDNSRIALHYLKFVISIVMLGIVIGSVIGTWLGNIVTGIFADFFRFPFLLFSRSPDLYATAAALSLLAAVLGAVRALREVVMLAPAIAMQPPAPPSFQRLFPAKFSQSFVSQPTLMVLRNVSGHPIRAAFTLLGMAFGSAILIVSLFTRDTMEQLIDVTYFMSDRQDATISFIEKRPRVVVNEVGRLPGVLVAEPYRDLPVRIRKANVERRLMITGRPATTDLNRIIDVNLRPVELPESGLAISAMLAEILGVRVGDPVEVDLLESQRRTIILPISALIEDYFGIKAIMNADALAHMLREAPTVTSVQISLDDNQLGFLYDALKRLPTVGGVSLQRASLANFRKSLAIVVTLTASIYTGLAAVIAFGVVYNSARISLSERARELASLRVLGFTRGEVLWILLLELVLLAVLAQPVGWAIGYGLAWVMRNNLAGELMRVRLVVEPFTYLLASGIVLTAAALSALVIRERVRNLDLVSVLKTRD